MMNKLVTKSTKKLGLVSIVMSAIVVLAALFTIIFGVNTAATISDNQTLTVKISAFYYQTKLDDIKDVCETEFDNQNVNVLYSYDAIMTGDECEVMYVFDKDADLSAVKTALETTFAGTDYESAFISLEQGNEVVQSAIPTVAIVRAAVAVLVFAILAFIYVAIRHGLLNGIVAGGAAFAATLVATAIVLLVRIPVTASVVYACALAALMAASLVLFSLNKFRANETDASVEEKVASSVAVKETLGFTVALGGALVLVGAIATWPVRWFAICALVALVVAAAVALFFAPALQFVLLDKKAKEGAGRTKSGYVGAKKAEEVENF